MPVSTVACFPTSCVLPLIDLSMGCFKLRKLIVRVGSTMGPMGNPFANFTFQPTFGQTAGPGGLPLFQPFGRSTPPPQPEPEEISSMNFQFLVEVDLEGTGITDSRLGHILAASQYTLKKVCVVHERDSFSSSI